MNILSVHNRYLQRGGEDESTELENSLLRTHSHNVVEYMVDNHDLQHQALIGIGVRSIWNHNSYLGIRELIRRHQIDLVKVDNFFPQISPAVFYAARAERVTTVQTLRNFRLACPGAVFFRDGKVCEDCLGKMFPWPGVIHGCYRKSRAQTIAPALMSYVHGVSGTWKKCISAYIALTEFSRDKFIEIGLPEEKIFVKPNFVIDGGMGSGDGDFALYVGRLSPEKGIDLLLSGWKIIGSRLRLKIVGTGPLEEEVKKAAAVNPAITFLGQLPLAEAYELMGKASVVIFSSKWYETFGRTVAEAFAKGTPVIAANVGTMRTMVKHQVNGLHFDPNATESLVEQVEWMLAHRDNWREMRIAARQTYESHYTPERNYEMLIQIYDQVTSANRIAR